MMKLAISLLILIFSSMAHADGRVGSWVYYSASGISSFKDRDTIGIILQPLTFCYSTPAEYIPDLPDNYTGVLYLGTQAVEVDAQVMKSSNPFLEVYVCTTTQRDAEYAMDYLWNNKTLLVRWEGLGNTFDTQGLKEAFKAMSDELSQNELNNAPAL